MKFFVTFKIELYSVSSLTKVAGQLKKYDPVPVDFLPFTSRDSGYELINVIYEVEAENRFEAAVTAGVIQKTCIEPTGKIVDDYHFEIGAVYIEEQTTKQVQKE